MASVNFLRVTLAPAHPLDEFLTEGAFSTAPGMWNSGHHATLRRCSINCSPMNWV
jgi:hypothetical protein